METETRNKIIFSVVTVTGLGCISAVIGVMLKKLFGPEFSPCACMLLFWIVFGPGVWAYLRYYGELGVMSNVAMWIRGAFQLSTIGWSIVLIPSLILLYVDLLVVGNRFGSTPLSVWVMRVFIIYLLLYMVAGLLWLTSNRFRGVASPDCPLCHRSDAGRLERRKKIGTEDISPDWVLAARPSDFRNPDGTPSALAQRAELESETARSFREYYSCRYCGGVWTRIARESWVTGAFGHRNLYCGTEVCDEKGNPIENRDKDYW